MESTLLKIVNDMKQRGVIIIIEDLGTISGYIQTINNNVFVHINNDLADKQMVDMLERSKNVICKDKIIIL